MVEEPVEPTPEPPPEPVVEEPPPEPSAPPEAAPEVVTEAEPPGGAVESALRPPSRPNRPEPTVEEPEEEVEVAEVEEPEPAEDPEPSVEEPAEPDEPEVEEPAEPEEPATQTAEVEEPTGVAEDDVLAALEAAAGSDAPAAAADPGPPMTSGERDAFRLAVQACWSVGSISTDAQQTVVTVSFELGRDGRVVGEPVLVESQGASSEEAARSAFEAARRAIVRCQGAGFPLPPEKYEQWRDVLMTFNPTNGGSIQ